MGIRARDVQKPMSSLLAGLAREQARSVTSSRLAGSGISVTGEGSSEVSDSVIIPAGGRLLVDGGDVLLLDADGSELLRIGPQQYGDRGVTIYRNDGTPALQVRNSFGPDDSRQSLTIKDPLGATIAGDSILSSSGFDAPHLSMPWRPVDNADARATSSTSFTALFEHRGYRQNPALTLRLLVWCSDATTAGEVQVWNVLNAAYLTPWFLGPPPSPWTGVVAAGTTTPTVLESVPLLLPGQMSAHVHYEIRVRRTAGTGTVSVAVQRSIGTGF